MIKGSSVVVLGRKVLGFWLKGALDFLFLIRNIFFALGPRKEVDKD